MAWQFAAGEILTAANLNAVTKPWNAICQVRTSAGVSIANNSVTAVSFDTEDLDVLGWHAGGSPTLVTPTIAGWYRCTFELNFATDTDYLRQQIKLQKSGVDLGFAGGGFRIEVSPRGNGISNYVGAFPLVWMNGSSDTLRLMVFQTNTSAAANNVDSTFLVELIYPT